jgi:hypothetical protein
MSPKWETSYDCKCGSCEGEVLEVGLFKLKVKYSDYQEYVEFQIHIKIPDKGVSHLLYEASFPVDGYGLEDGGFKRLMDAAKAAAISELQDMFSESFADIEEAMPEQFKNMGYSEIQDEFIKLHYKDDQ